MLKCSKTVWKVCVCKVFMPTPLNDERAVNTIAYLRLNVYESFSASMSGFLEVAVTYTFQSPLYVRSSGSSAYRRGSCGHLSFIYVQRGRASRFWRSRGREARKISFQLFFSRFFPNCPPPSGRPSLNLMVEEVSFPCLVWTAILVFLFAQRFRIALRS